MEAGAGGEEAEEAGLIVGLSRQKQGYPVGLHFVNYIIAQICDLIPGPHQGGSPATVPVANAIWWSRD